MTAREKWVQALTVPGGLAVLIGGIDPLEGSILILIGTALLVAAARMGQLGQNVQRMRAFILAFVTLGFAAIWTMTAIGGVGGTTGRSLLWMVLCLPLAVGWSLSFWARGAPRWMTWLGLLAGGWYLALPLVAVAKARANPHILWSVLAALGVCGLVTLAGCVWRLRQPRPIGGNT